MKKNANQKQLRSLFFNENSAPHNPAPRKEARLREILHKHERNEAKLRRAFKAWEKTNAALRRLEKQLDKLTSEDNA